MCEHSVYIYFTQGGKQMNFSKFRKLDYLIFYLIIVVLFVMQLTSLSFSHFNMYAKSKLSVSKMITNKNIYNYHSVILYGSYENGTQTKESRGIL